MHFIPLSVKEILVSRIWRDMLWLDVEMPSDFFNTVSTIISVFPFQPLNYPICYMFYVFPNLRQKILLFGKDVRYQYFLDISVKAP